MTVTTDEDRSRPLVARSGPSVLDCLAKAMQADPALTLEQAIRTVPITTPYEVRAGCCMEGLVPVDECNCGAGPNGYYGMHERLCGYEPCPNGCWERLPPVPEAS